MQLQKQVFLANQELMWRPGQDGVSGAEHLFAYCPPTSLHPQENLIMKTETRVEKEAAPAAPLLQEKQLPACKQQRL